MIIESQFKPAWWLKNRHCQTIWQKIERRKLKCETIEQTIELDDGDFIQLNWTEKPNKDCNKPIVLVLHGLEGSINSTYAKGMMNAIKHKGWIGVLLHFRSCGGRPNRLMRAYHSGETTDLAFIANWLKKQYPETPLSCISFSLGANVLCKYLGESGELAPFIASVGICPPLDLAASCVRIQKGFSKVYQKYLLDMMLDNITRKLQRVDLSHKINISPKALKSIKNLWQFDDLITAPLHDFHDASDYYQQSSGKQFLKNIQKPTLLLHALDDPFLSNKSVPKSSDLSHRVTYEMSKFGGHVGFISGKTPFKGEYWMETRSLSFIENHL
ncbi:hydrolase [Catenovulum maritimum]|uniref:AB hydrolase-1 domain-containing protein n=1 Tax=Catenovulum maritimum TaxID=1513271 RepID=A0A0J8H0C0_9ALTE|nr:hydrolase [Catenovulum maritimum]KMT66463.1 hypothetical protein XM47_02660 [Catenovulum maritimum]